MLVNDESSYHMIHMLRKKALKISPVLNWNRRIWGTIGAATVSRSLWPTEHWENMHETDPMTHVYPDIAVSKLTGFIDVIWVRGSLSRVMIYEIFMTSPEWGLAHLLCAKRYTSFSSYKLNIKLINLLI